MPTSPDVAILANLVKSIQGEAEDPLSPLIEEYFTKRKLPEFRKKRLKSITLDVEERSRPGGRLSPSSICGCEREAAFKFIGVKGSRRTNVDLELIFEDGHWRHHKWQTIFKDMELVLGRDRFRLCSIEFQIRMDDLLIAGHLDAEVKILIRGEWVRYVIDIKGANNFAFERTYRDRAPDPTYIKQLMTYMKGRKCKRGILLFDSKDKNKFYCFVVEANPEKWGEIRRWSRSVIRQIDERKLPPMHEGCKNGNFLYNRCAYRGLCFGKKTAKQVEREVFVDFPGVQKQWEESHGE